ncbi:MAG: hypothetical protein A2452_10080 [Candidatus Firestonebacteria bacterium RIFOXYC2_FULL_39_67]|nr:MAG: hypothetical protein A2536_04525 [Candidatus Firestonebacteria bacterium RIFOXYD2_FULL_39_29]OGF56721.1 MAG: hypothetical protein A2497_07870 [Candidatus Firestonebacteria bacterium RifOxyC12_full_39_7]OGF57369.1 MAG: hypothetical protein A2452_10080 [Candidatus Firestonebacteria bacterium RIFOXYC2_FULL_39_67]
MSLKFKKKEVKMPREVLLKSRPLKNPGIKYEEKNGEIHLALERKKTLSASLLAKIFIVPRNKVLILDKIGSEVWKLCDGKNKLVDIIKQLSKNHKLSQYEAEVSLMEYFKILAKRGIIGLEVSKKDVEKG